MKTEHKVITFSLIFGLLFWIVDSVLDFFLFYKGTFPELLITNVPPHELYIRSVVIAFFLIFGFIMLRFIARLKVEEEKLNKSNRLYATLGQVNQAIVREKDKQKLFQEICDIMIKFGKFRFVWIGLIDEKAKIVKPVAFSGEGSDYIQNIKISITDDLTRQGPTGRSVCEGKNVIFNDLENNPDFKPWRKQALEKGYRSSASFPIRLNSVVIGALGIYAVEPEFFDKDEIELLEEAALDISFALDNFEEEEKRNRLKEALLIEKDNLNSVFEAMIDGVYIVNEQYDIQYVNPILKKDFGIYESRKCYEYFHDREDVCPWCKNTDVLAGKTVRWEWYSSKNQKTYDLIDTPIKNSDGSISKLEIFRDITERKKTEEEILKLKSGLEVQIVEKTKELNEKINKLSRSQKAMVFMVEDINEARKKLKDVNTKLNRSFKKIENSKNQIDGILKSVVDGIIVTDFDNKVVLVNRIIEELFGIRGADVIGKPMDLILNDKELLEKFNIAFSDLDTGHNFDFKKTSENANDDNIYNARVSAIWDKNGIITGMITTFRDVTREREIDRMKTEFISTSAHELRTPLTSIQGFSEILLTRADLKTEERKKFLEYINKQSISLGNIINDLLDVSRIESESGFILRKGKCNAGEILESVVNNYRSVSEKHIFKIELLCGSVKLYADKDLITQAVSNLISNAVKYSPEAGEILISSGIEGGNYIFSIYDEGIGMTPDQVRRIFDKFYRADASNTAIEGTGLGMGIVKHIVELHGGEIRVESEFGKWTRVTFTIPMIEKKGN